MPTKNQVIMAWCLSLLIIVATSLMVDSWVSGMLGFFAGIGFTRAVTNTI